MAEILDHTGQPARKKFVHGADTSRMSGPQFRTENKSLDELITERDRDVIVALSKRLTANSGVAKCVIDQKATYSVGQAWMPSYTGTEDRDKAKEVLDWFNNSFSHSCDVRGGMFDWRENLKLVSKEIDLTGDHFTLLTTNEDGTEPRFKNIPSYAVRTKGADIMMENGVKIIQNGNWKGYKIIHGIIYDDHDKAVAYRVSTGKGNDDFEDIDAAHIHHSFNPMQSDGRRGLPSTTHALEELKHMLQSNAYERNRQLLLSSIGLIVENEIGGVDMEDPQNVLEGSDGETQVVAKKIDSAIWYTQAGSGEKISQMKHESGGDTFESFQDRMIRSYVTGAGWSYSLTWKPTGQGTAERGEILQARKSVIERQSILDKWALWVFTHAYSFKANQGDLPVLSSPFAWKFSKPPRISVDDGKEGKELRESYRLGSKNFSDLHEVEGKTFEQHLDERLDEIVMMKVKIAEREKANPGISIDQREIVMLTPNETKEDEESNNKNQQD